MNSFLMKNDEFKEITKQWDVKKTYFSMTNLADSTCYKRIIMINSTVLTKDIWKITIKQDKAASQDYHVKLPSAKLGSGVTIAFSIRVHVLVLRDSRLVLKCESITVTTINNWLGITFMRSTALLWVKLLLTPLFEVSFSYHIISSFH